METNDEPARAPSLRQILSFMGIEHSGSRGRLYYLARLDRDRANRPAPSAIRGLEVTEIEPELVELSESPPKIT